MRLTSEFTECYRQFMNMYFSWPNVVGIDIGFRYVDEKKTHETAVRVYVKEKFPEWRLSNLEILPVRCGNVPVDVIEAGFDYFGSCTRKSQRDSSRNPGQTSSSAISLNGEIPSIQPGERIYRTASDGGSGTFGLIVFHNGRDKCLLSNWHVLSTTFGSCGDEIYCDTLHGEGRRVIAFLGDAILDRDGDAAIAYIKNDGDILSKIKQEQKTAGGVLIKEACTPQLGETLVKFGPATRETKAQVDGIGTYKIQYSVGIAPISVAIDGFKLVRLEKEDSEVSQPGDSGAVWYDPETQTGIGLHFAGEVNNEPDYALACHLTRVLKRLDVTLVES
jgi:hypothetical protein